MAPRCIVTDLDRTLTGPDLALDPRALARIDDLRSQGIRVVVATGRTIEHLDTTALPARLDGIVAENGAIVRVPSLGILEAREPDFVPRARAALAHLADAFHWGRALGSGPRALAPEAARLLRRARIEHHIEFNAEETMILPRGVDKATGATRCLRLLGLDAKDAWAIGDGENDVPLLQWAALTAAPANAAPAAHAAAHVQVAARWSDAFLAFTEPLLATRPMAR